MKLKHSFTRAIAFCAFIAAIIGNAAACDALYNPVTGIATVPCVDAAGDHQSFSVTLQNTGPNTFAVTGVQEFTLADPVIAELRIITSPALTAVVSGFYAACGGGNVSQGSFSRTGDNVDIRVKMRVPPTRDPVCEASAGALQPFAQAVPFFVGTDPRTQTYSVNGTRVIPVFVGDPFVRFF